MHHPSSSRLFSVGSHSEGAAGCYGNVSSRWIKPVEQWLWWPVLFASPEIYSKFWVSSLLSLDSTTEYTCALILFIIRFLNVEQCLQYCTCTFGWKRLHYLVILLLKETYTTLLPKAQLNEFELPDKSQILTRKDQVPAMKAPLLHIIYRGM